jgi:hypothetical protein
MPIIVSDEGYVVTFPRALSSIFAESEGYKPAEFDRWIEISGEIGSSVAIDENMLLEAMPDFIQFLPCRSPILGRGRYVWFRPKATFEIDPMNGP